MRTALWFAGLAAMTATAAFGMTSLDDTGISIPTDPYQSDGELPTNVLLIQDQQGWGYNAHITILNGSGVSYTVINSSQIAAHDFGPYDKIITVGQQPDAYYYAIDSNRSKFESYMNEGGCCSFETANYFGYPNETITWPGGFMAVINGGSNSVAIDDESNCLVSGVSLGELQGWNYSAHGIHTGLPGGYVSVVSTLDGSPNGSCAGWFPWGAGGAFVSHQPLEWGWNGFSVTYPTNFDLCECGEPTATEETTWGEVKSLYR